MSENTDYDKACREIARIAAALGIVDYSGDTSEIFDSIIIKNEKHQSLAGENAVMLKLLTDISENHSEFVDEGEDCMCASIPLDYVSEINMHVSRDVNAENPFIATDKALNEIKAQSIESALDAQIGKQAVTDELTGKVYLCAADLRQFAASLRGVQNV